MTTTKTKSDVALIAHLIRRAGFGATADQLDALTLKGYEAVVADLLHPARVEYMPEDILRRFHMDYADLRTTESSSSYWIYRKRMLLANLGSLRGTDSSFTNTIFLLVQRLRQRLQAIVLLKGQ